MVSRSSQGKGDRASSGSKPSRRAAERFGEGVTFRVSTGRAAALVALGALVQAVVVPYLAFGLVAPALALICVVVAVASLKWVIALPLGFFGGILVDALGSGLFGVGALSGVLAAALSSWVGVVGEKASTRLRLAGVVALAVAVHDLASVAALGLSGQSWPPMIEFVALGVLPDAVLNAALAYVAGGTLMRLVRVKERAWT